MRGTKIHVWSLVVALSTIVCLAAGLWLAVACSEAKVEEPDAAPIEFGRDDPHMLCRPEEHDREATREQVKALVDKHLDWFFGLPGVFSAGPANLFNEDGSRTDFIGIYLSVEGEMIDWNAVPPKDRVPGCLDGIPVQFEWGFHLRFP